MTSYDATTCRDSTPPQSVSLDRTLIEMLRCWINNVFLTERSKIHNSNVLLEMSPSMDAVFDVDHPNAIFSPNWRCTSKVCD